MVDTRLRRRRQNEEKAQTEKAENELKKSDVDETDADDEYDSSTVEPQPKLLVDEEPKSKWASFITRVVYSLLMVVSFLFIVIYLQQAGCTALVFILQGIMYKELITLLTKEQRERELPGFKLLYVYWFLVCSFMVYGSVLESHFLMHSLHDVLGGFRISKHLQNHRLYSFLLYVFGIVMFVWSLRKRRHYRYQFKQFAYAHMTLVLIVAQSSFLVSNMFNGMIWFLLPCSLIIANDVFAYLFGFCFGRTPLIRLSPKKTWEGFIGGWVSTMVIGIINARVFSLFSLMICPRLGFALEYWPSCDENPLFTYMPLPQVVGENIAAFLPGFMQTWQLMPFDEHVFWMSMFASIVAPFGGFFASGFKRAFKIKDFGQSIPGHGGITDRMDCQVMMGMFVYVYYNARVALEGDGGAHPEVIYRLLSQLPAEDQLRVYNDLAGELTAKGLL